MDNEANTLEGHNSQSQLVQEMISTMDKGEIQLSKVADDANWEANESSSAEGSDLHIRQVPSLNFENNQANPINQAKVDTQLRIGQLDVPFPT